MYKDDNDMTGSYMDKKMRFTKEAFAEETLEKIQAKYRAYTDGKIARTEWGEYICSLLSAWIDYEFKDKKRKLGQDWEDAKQSAYLAIMNSLDSYDPFYRTDANPNGTKPSTFFGKAILGAVRAEASKGIDPAILDIRNKLNRALATCVKADGQLMYPQLLATPGLSVTTVYEVYRSTSNGKIISLQQIKNTMDVLYAANTIESIDGMTGDDDSRAYEIPSPADSPQVKVEKKMQQEVIDRAFATLNPWEQYVVDKVVGLSSGHSAEILTLVKYINAHFDQFAEKFGEYEAIFRKEGCISQMCQHAIMSTCFEAYRKMANFEPLARNFPRILKERFMFDSRSEDNISYEDLVNSVEFQMDIRSTE